MDEVDSGDVACFASRRGVGRKILLRAEETAETRNPYPKLLPHREREKL